MYALDPSLELYTLARERIGKASFPIEHLAVSAEKIPLPDESIDGVISTWSLCSIPHPETALKEIFRVLKPGGVFSFVEHGASPHGMIKKLQHLFTPITAHCAGGCHLNRNMEALIKEAGFEIKGLEQFALPKKPLAHMYKGVAVKAASH